jgi:hypothetical protein
MAKKKSSSTAQDAKQINRESLPEDLTVRLRTIWSKLGHLVDWCHDDTSWMQMFCSEPRPYRETFYWEAVAEMVFDYVENHSTAAPESVLTDCLIATQSSPSSDDPDRLVHFRQAWDRILDRSRPEIEAFIKSDFELAMQDGTYDTIAAMYAADYHKWETGHSADS